MFCNFCGRNFDAQEGFEEVNRARHHLIRCEKCVYEQREEEYNWQTQVIGRGHSYFSEADKLKKGSGVSTRILK